VIVVIADQPAVAALAAVDLAEADHSDVRLLEGGMRAWRDAGLPIEASPDRPTAAEAIDFLRFVHDRHEGNLDASLQYLAWEKGLIGQLDAAERREFRLATPAS
jgi:3-mercaptopyruvate sulfurtransferase SseA